MSEYDGEGHRDDFFRERYEDGKLDAIFDEKLMPFAPE